MFYLKPSTVSLISLNQSAWRTLLKCENFMAEIIICMKPVGSPSEVFPTLASYVHKIINGSLTNGVVPEFQTCSSDTSD